MLISRREELGVFSVCMRRIVPGRIVKFGPPTYITQVCELSVSICSLDQRASLLERKLVLVHLGVRQRGGRGRHVLPGACAVSAP